ncbi:uncharacterized protein KIAA0754-like [Prunus avium]|uniref:Uncharacterized protein KIAA0754-like n=1 Tax=Prunus avium TaxID=42229 RepID=A0A6P5TSV1_PRUAV|nr:uncharacterized protein KIAA0754-like [Prunus avium]
MVRSRMSYTDLPVLFWGYALQTEAYLLNKVPSKSVPRTPYEMWFGRKPSLNHLKIWGCPAYVKKHDIDKLDARSEICRFIGYRKETLGYYFYHPNEQKVFVARSARFLEIDFALDGTCVQKVELKEESGEPHEPEVESDPVDNPVPLPTLTQPLPLSRKRSREVAATGTPCEAGVAETSADASEGIQAAEARTEAAVVEPPRKKILLILSEGEDEEEAPPATGTVTNAEAEAEAEEVPISEASIAEAEGAGVEGVEASIAEAEGAGVEGVEASIAEAEGAGVEGAEASIAEAAAVDPPLETLVESSLMVEAVASLAVTALIEPPLVTPCRPGGIVFRSPPRPSSPSSTALVAPSPQVVSAAMSIPLAPLSQESTVVTELVVAEVLAAPSAAEETTSSDDLEELYASLHEEGGSSTSAPVDEDSRVVVERH